MSNMEPITETVFIIVTVGLMFASFAWSIKTFVSLDLTAPKSDCDEADE